jgi:hypothetical protein
MNMTLLPVQVNTIADIRDDDFHEGTAAIGTIELA